MQQRPHGGECLHDRQLGVGACGDDLLHIAHVVSQDDGIEHFAKYITSAEA
jgi:hypothetical protein